jgi:hypothetical protein
MFCGTSMDEAAIALAGRRLGLETDLAGCVLSDHVAGVAAALTAGVTEAAFSHYDLRLIFAACVVHRDRPLPDVLLLARDALRADCYWTDDHLRGTGSIWSAESLSDLAGSWPSSAPVPIIAAELLGVQRRLDAAAEHLAAAARALSGEGVPDADRHGVPAVVMATPVMRQRKVVRR